MTTTTEGSTMTTTTDPWTADPAAGTHAAAGVVLLSYTRPEPDGSTRLELQQIATLDLRRVLDAARPVIDRHRAMRDDERAGSYERAASHAIVAAHELLDQVVLGAELAQ